MTAHAVVAVASRRATALVNRDWGAVAEQLHPDFVYLNANDDRLRAHEYVAFLRDGPIRWTEQRLEDVEVAGTGSVAVLTATVHDHVLVHDQPAHWVFTTMQTYVQEGDVWRYLAGHTSLPAG
jgi:Domain of unknown function (DUF4440)